MSVQINVDAYRATEPFAREICSDLFAATPIKSFYYGRYFEDGRMVSLNTHTDLFVKFLQDFTEYVHPKNVMGQQTGFFLLDDHSPQALKELTHAHKNRDAINFVKHGEGYTEEFGFATAEKHDHIIDFYLNNIEIFEKFGRYFTQRAQKLIDNDDLVVQFPHITNNNHSDKIVNVLKEQMQSVFMPPYQNKLSKREVECFRLLIRGKTRDQMAELLNISRSSVGTYLDRIMRKFSCKNRSELVNYAWENEIIRVND